MIFHESAAARVAYERAQANPIIEAPQHQSLVGVQGPVDLFKVFGIDVVREKLYTRQPDSAADQHNGIYWALPTVDQDARTKAWDVRIGYIGNGGVPRLAYWFRQGDPQTPKAMAGVTIVIRSDGTPVLTMTEDVAEGALFPPMVFILSPVSGV